MGPTLLLYNLGDQAPAILDLARRAGFSPRQVLPMEQGQTLSAALGLTPPAKASGAVSGSMLVFFATAPETMSAFLDQLRQNSLALAALKAIATATNLNWPAPKLFTELRREHRAMGG